MAEAIAAVYRTVSARTERHLGSHATSGAGHVVHFALLITAAATATAVLLLAGCTAIRATTGFVGETFLLEEVLLGSGEHEIGATIAAG